MKAAKPPEFPWVSPYITVTDVDKALDFYTKAFGFTLKEKSGEHAEMVYKDQILMFGKEGKYGEFETKTPKSSGQNSSINMYIYCEDVNNFYTKAIEHGAEGFSPPEDMFWGDRMCRLKCPDGYIWAFATFLGVPCNQK